MNREVSLVTLDFLGQEDLIGLVEALQLKVQLVLVAMSPLSVSHREFHQSS